MPELAEVEFFRRQWNPGLRKPIRQVTVHGDKRLFRDTDVSALVRHLRGDRLISSTAHGKQLLFRSSTGAWLGVHLGMTGELRRESARFNPGPHDHLALHLEDSTLVFADPRQFGRVRFHAGPEAPVWWRDLPPELTSPEFTSEFMQGFLRRHRRAPLKAVLLSQAGFPGLGNWMADEVLWRAGVHPKTHAESISRPAANALWRAVRFVSSGALRMVAKDYSDPPSSWLFRHRWEEGGRCPKHRTLLARETVGGRTTVWCPRCQPEPRNTRTTRQV